MDKNTLYATPNPPGPPRPVIFDPDVCLGCNSCIEICQMDVMLPNPESGGPPIIMYPDECWYCGDCVSECPEEAAIKFNQPLLQRVNWKRKSSNAYFRL